MFLLSIVGVAGSLATILHDAVMNPAEGNSNSLTSSVSNKRYAVFTMV